MTTVQLHTAPSLSPASAVVHALHVALQQFGSELQAAFEAADPGRVAVSLAQVLQQTAMAGAAHTPVPATRALVQALVLEVAFQPLVALDDGTLVENLFEVWIDRQAWQVERVAVPVVFDQLLAGLRAAGQEVTWSCKSTGQGHATVQAWAPIGARYEPRAGA